MAERTVQTVKTYLAKYLKEYPSMEFDNALGWVMMIMNALESSATGASPYFIENGCEFRLPFLSSVL